MFCATRLLPTPPRPPPTATSRRAPRIPSSASVASSGASESRPSGGGKLSVTERSPFALSTFATRTSRSGAERGGLVRRGARPRSEPRAPYETEDARAELGHAERLAQEIVRPARECID